MVEQKKITPALRFDRLTPLYDHIVRYTTRERRFKSVLLKAAAIKRGDSILDVGCGTGTLLQSIADATFDRVVSTLFFHHLVAANKRATVAEIARVLRPRWCRQRGLAAY